MTDSSIECKEFFLILHGWKQYSIEFQGVYSGMWYIPYSGYVPLPLALAFDKQTRINNGTF
jgi:hypothetical protein